MYKVASIDEKSFTQIIASQVKTRITINDPAKLKTHDVKLVLRFDFTDEGEKEYQFVLKLINSQTIKTNHNWLGKTPIRHQYEFQLSENSLFEFKKYQRAFLKYGKPKNYYWTVYYYLAHQPEDEQSLDLDLELKLANNDEYFYLLKDASVDIAR